MHKGILLRLCLNMPLHWLYHFLNKYQGLIQLYLNYLMPYITLPGSGEISKSTEYLLINFKWFGNELRIINTIESYKNILEGAELVTLGSLVPDELLIQLGKDSRLNILVSGLRE